MEQQLLKAWRNQAKWLYLLLPLSWLYRLIFWFNKSLYNLGLKKIYYADVPVIVIGNITVGGSGKTPLIIAVVNYLQKKGIRVGVISRGYGGQVDKMPCLVTADSLPSEVGDEPCLIVQQTGVPMAVGPNRGQAIELLLNKNDGIQIILSDDGLQHFALDRDENWVVVDADRGFGNRQLLPTGFLREPISRLNAANTTIIFHQSNWAQKNTLVDFANSLSNNTNSTSAEFRIRLIEKPLEPLFKDTNVSTLDEENNNKIIAMTGIGFPQRFFKSLEKIGFEVCEHPFNDHHQYQLQDFENLPNLPIVVTDKDAVKLRVLFKQSRHQYQDVASKIWVLPVEAELSHALYVLIDKQIDDLIQPIKTNNLG